MDIKQLLVMAASDNKGTATGDGSLGWMISWMKDLLDGYLLDGYLLDGGSLGWMISWMEGIEDLDWFVHVESQSLGSNVNTRDVRTKDELAKTPTPKLMG